MAGSDCHKWLQLDANTSRRLRPERFYHIPFYKRHKLDQFQHHCPDLIKLPDSSLTTSHSSTRPRSPFGHYPSATNSNERLPRILKPSSALPLLTSKIIHNLATTACSPRSQTSVMTPSLLTRASRTSEHFGHDSLPRMAAFTVRLPSEPQVPAAPVLQAVTLFQITFTTSLQELKTLVVHDFDMSIACHSGITIDGLLNLNGVFPSIPVHKVHNYVIEAGTLIQIRCYDISCRHHTISTTPSTTSHVPRLV